VKLEGLFGFSLGFVPITRNWDSKSHSPIKETKVYREIADSGGKSGKHKMNLNQPRLESKEFLKRQRDHILKEI
jgi:predicted transposase YdaD